MQKRLAEIPRYGELPMWIRIELLRYEKTHKRSNKKFPHERYEI